MIDIRIKVSWDYFEQTKDNAKPVIDEIKKLLDENLNEEYKLNFVFREHGPFGGDDSDKAELTFTEVGWKLEKINKNI